MNSPHDVGESFATVSRDSAEPVILPARLSRKDDQVIRLNILRALRLHTRLAFGFAVAGLLLALAYGVMQWPVYTAKSQIYVQPVQPRVMTLGNEQNASVNAVSYDAYIQQQVQSASSPAVLRSAIAKLGPGAWQRNSESEQAAVDRLGRAIEAARVGTGYEVAITARASDPSLASKIANAVADSIQAKASGEGNAGDAERIAVLKEERERIESELKQDYAEQDDLNKQLGMASVGPVAPDLIDDRIAKTREEFIKAQTDYDQAAAKFSALRAEQSDSAAMKAEADELIAADAGLSSMKTLLNQRRAVLITQMANLTPQNPGYRLASDELAKINKSLDAMKSDLRAEAAARIQQKLKTDLERTARVEDQLNGQLRELARTAAGATPKLQRVTDLAADIVRLRNRYSIVDEQLHNLMIEDSVPGAVHVSLPAVLPLHPSIGRILKGALPLALGGMLLGLVAAIFVNKLDQRVYIAADIEQALGFAPIAVLPDFDEVSDAVAAEHIKRLAAAIEHAGRKSNLQTCMFTGASRGTGVSLLADRVKPVLQAMRGDTVVLDATGHEPVSIAERDDPAAPRKTGKPNSELQQDSLVLIETAPLLLSAETEYIARSVDGVIVVVESGVTTRAQLAAALNTLQRLEVGAVGFVLNRVALAKADSAFRQSLLDMEKHFHDQGASSSMWPVRWHGYVNERVPVPGISVEKNELPARAKTETGVPTGERVGQQLPAQVLPFVKPAEQVLQPRATPPEKHEMPWWMPQAAVREDAGAAQERECAKAPDLAEPLAVPPPRIQPPQLPDWFWNSGAGGSGDFTQIPATEAASETAGVVSSELRMERLRGLFANVGLADLHRNRTPLAEIAEQRSHEDATPRAAAPVSAESEKAETKRAVAVPREYVPLKDPVSDPAAEPSRHSRFVTTTAFDDDDEIRILPARRGQYGSR